MQYCKPPLSVFDQVLKLKNRGLTFADERFAEKWLSNVSYYRLRAYTYPFQDNTNVNHPFVCPVSFEEIIDLYLFDGNLRILVMDALEKIEIALRTQIIYQWALTYGSHWHLKAHLFRDANRYRQEIKTLDDEITRSTEKFIDHYQNTYTSPDSPPAWMSLEVSSFGLLSKIFQNLKKGNEKLAVTRYFGLNDISILENWMHCFCHIRNICAHHSRLWNRRLTSHVKLPSNPANPFISNRNILPYKLYAYLCSIEYVMRAMRPDGTIKVKLIQLIDSSPLCQEKEMGFPENWRDDAFWK